MMLTRGHGHHTCMCGCLSGFYFLKEMKKKAMVFILGVFFYLSGLVKKTQLDISDV